MAWCSERDFGSRGIASGRSFKVIVTAFRDTRTLHITLSRSIDLNPHHLPRNSAIHNKINPLCPGLPRSSPSLTTRRQLPICSATPTSLNLSPQFAACKPEASNPCRPDQRPSTLSSPHPSICPPNAKARRTRRRALKRRCGG